MRKFAVLAAASFAVAACQDSTAPNPIVATPRVNAAQNGSQNDYIVTLSNDESDPEGAAAGLVKAHGGELKQVYRKAIKGFAVANLPDAAVEALRQNPQVMRVERDGIVTADATQTPTPSWGLDRIDARSGLDQSYTYPNDGTGVTAYIIDTGINSTTTDFANRIGTGSDFVDGGAPDDCNGHGTHVAGTVGGTTYGVAKNVRLVAVRVLNCQGSGTNSGVISGIEWVMNQTARPAVANMSLGGGFSQTLNDAVTNAVAAGVTFAIAAGNSTANACNYSPASTPAAITVGATTTSDALASYSNFGNCVDINAPGSGITSDWIGGTAATNTISGTSMATPHVTGAAALYLAANPNATPAAVASALTANATAGLTGTIPSGTPNKILYIGFIGGGTSEPPPPQGPVASINKVCSGFTCTFTSTSTGSNLTLAWSRTGGTSASATNGTQYVVTYGFRASGTVTLQVSNVDGSSSATVSVTCNPKKCQ